MVRRRSPLRADRHVDLQRPRPAGAHRHRDQLRRRARRGRGSSARRQSCPACHPLQRSGGDCHGTSSAPARQQLRAGRDSAVSHTVMQALRGYTTGQVSRLAGATRYETAARIAQAYWPQTSHVVYLATGRNFPDALAGVPAAGLDAAPLLLVEPGCMPAITKREIERLKPATTVALGGDSTVSAAATAGTVCGAAPTTPAPAPTTPSPTPTTPTIPPRPADVDCTDFRTQAEAQALFNRYLPTTATSHDSTPTTTAAPARPRRSRRRRAEEGRQVHRLAAGATSRQSASLHPA